MTCKRYDIDDELNDRRCMRELSCVSHTLAKPHKDVRSQFLIGRSDVGDEGATRGSSD